MSVVAAAGFRVAAATAGLRAAGGPDVALVVADEPAVAAAVFTPHAAAAAPISVSRAHLAAGPTARAVLVNAGCANAGTGAPGRAAALATAEATAKVLRCDVEDVLLCSTGPIGPRLPADKVAAAVAEAAAGLSRDREVRMLAARAIMTTDTVPKQTTIGGDGYVVGGMAKGAGMIRPDMATMLAVLTTDAVVAPAALDTALRRAVDRSFNSLNVDGCASTNDSVIVLASGAAGVTPDRAEFEATLTRACRELSLRIAEDAEGARRVVTLAVRGAATEAVARSIGKAVADSALVRASFYGGDPNWGRILGALGASGLPFDPERVSVAYEGTVVAEHGLEVDHDAAALQESLAHLVTMRVDVVVGDGPGRAEVVTTDLTPEYVSLNAEYS